MSVKYTQKPICIRDEPKLFKFGKISQYVDPYVWLFIGRVENVGFCIRFMLPLLTYSEKNFDPSCFEEVPGWSAPMFMFMFRKNQIDIRWTSFYLGPIRTFATFPVYDPNTEDLIEQWERDETNDYKAKTFWTIKQKRC